MAKLIGVVGKTGSGKTTACRNLDPKTTFYIDADKKGLSWKGWRKSFNKENKNYICNDDPTFIKSLLHTISDKQKAIKVVIVDTIGGIMIAEEMRRRALKTYDKWDDLANCIWDIFDDALTLRDDLTIIFMCHAQEDKDDFGNSFTHIQTSGKKLDKIVLETKLPIVFIAKCLDGENGRYVFETKAKDSTAKTPMGAFDSFEIPNDMVEVLKALEDF